VPATVLLQDLNRVRQIGVIAARHGFGEWLERAGVWRLLGRREKVEVSPESQRASTARRFRMLLNDLGPTFVKLGQILSTRADLLPAEFIEELATLQDQVEPIPLEDVYARIRESLGRDVKELFREVDPQPLAAASIAQVHRAVTLEGEEVVVKVQRPGIAERIDSDLVVLRSTRPRGSSTSSIGPSTRSWTSCTRPRTSGRSWRTTATGRT
jgi:ubiquinone biosynthesis protein